MNQMEKLTYSREVQNMFEQEVDIVKKIIAQEVVSLIEVDSQKPGLTTTVMVWVHGNELSGVNAVTDILKTIEVISWKVYFIFANLEAMKIDQRFFEKNMNRSFHLTAQWDTYEDKRAQEIIPYLLESDYLLDVHNTLNKQNSIPFLISEYQELSKYFAVKYVISWLDILHSGWSDGFMNSVWKIGLCLESWSIYDPTWPEIAKKWILNFLKWTKNISGTPEETSNQDFINLNYIYKNKTTDFKFTKKFLDFEKVPAWFIIAYDGEEEVKFDEDRVILFTHDVKDIWEECFCTWKVI